MPKREVRIAEPANGEILVPLGIQPEDYIEQGTDEDTGHGRRKFEGQSIHGDTVRKIVYNLHANYSARDLRPLRVQLNFL